MDYLHEVGAYLNKLSDQADKIRQLNRDSYKHDKDMEILEKVMQQEIDRLEEPDEESPGKSLVERNYEAALLEILQLRRNFEYTDEWQEAEAFVRSEEIARKALGIIKDSGS